MRLGEERTTTRICESEVAQGAGSGCFSSASEWRSHSHPPESLAGQRLWFHESRRTLTRGVVSGVCARDTLSPPSFSPLALAIFALPSHAKRGHRSIDSGVRVGRLHSASRRVCVRTRNSARPCSRNTPLSGPWLWPCAPALYGLALALIPIRRGERWALWLSAVTLLILVAERIATDARCLAVLDLNHGCHDFMISMRLGLVGLALAAPRSSKPRRSQRAVR